MEVTPPVSPDPPDNSIAQENQTNIVVGTTPEKETKPQACHEFKKPEVLQLQHSRKKHRFSNSHIFRFTGRISAI